MKKFVKELGGKLNVERVTTGQELEGGRSRPGEVYLFEDAKGRCYIGSLELSSDSGVHLAYRDSSSIIRTVPVGQLFYKNPLEGRRIIPETPKLYKIIPKYLN
jgi:hypothetical protein